MSLWSAAHGMRPLVAVLGALALGLSACAKPIEVGPQEPMQQGNASVTVASYELVYVDLESPTGAVAMNRPVLKVELDVQAIGEVPVSWNPGFESAGATQAQNVLLFRASSWADGLNPSNNVGAVSTSGYRYLDDPVTEPVEIAPGTTVRDVLLFSAPPSSTTGLVLSIPPQVFGPEEKLPGYIRLPFSGGEAEALPVAALNEAYEGREFTFTVTGADVVYAKMKDPESKDAISRDPLLRIAFQVKNTGDAPMNYTPTVLSSGIDFPALTDQNDALQNRAIFVAGVEIEGQHREVQTIAPGATIRDAIYFDRPPRSVETLKLLYPGRRLGGSGLVRVEFPYTWADPEVPEEFQAK